MRLQAGRYWLWAFTIALLAGCSSIVVKPGTAFDPAGPYTPLLFEVTPPAGYAGRAWVFGALHAASKDLYPLPVQVLSRWQKSDVLAIELDIQTRRDELVSEFLKSTRLPEGERLEDYLDPDTIKALRQRFAITDERWAPLSRLQPWTLTRVLRGANEPPGKARRYLGTERVFLTKALERAVPRVELERPVEQVAALTGGPLPEQIALLRYRVRRPEFWDNKIDELIRAWRRGDAKSLLALKQREFGRDPVDGRSARDVRAGLRQRLFTARDRQMARRLLEQMRERRTIFAVIGTYHLVGPTSLLSQLSALGATVQRVDYDSTH